MPRYIDADVLDNILAHQYEARMMVAANSGSQNQKYVAEGIAFAQVVANQLIPPADVQEVKHGFWFFAEYEYFNCSVCGEAYYNGCNSSAEARDCLKKEYDLYRYCPNCGAKMDGEKE